MSMQFNSDGLHSDSLPKLGDVNPDLHREAKSRFLIPILVGSISFMIVAIAMFSGYWMGQRQERTTNGIPWPKEVSATATHGGANLAVATGLIGDDVEGIFFLDYITGNLQCWVYYPRSGAFGGKFEGNVTQDLPATKNAEYLLVTGSIAPPPTTGNARPAGCLVYVIDVKSGQFAAYTIPWVHASATSLQPQMGQFVLVGGDVFRNPMGGGAGGKKPAAPAPAPGRDKANPAPAK